MRTARRIPARGAIAILIAISPALWGCASQRTPEGVSLETRNDYEVACGVALLNLKELIETRSTQADFSLAVLIEAREIYDLARELYLEREYALALELTEEGIHLVEEERD